MMVSVQDIDVVVAREQERTNTALRIRENIKLMRALDDLNEAELRTYFNNARRESTDRFGTQNLGNLYLGHPFDTSGVGYGHIVLEALSQVDELASRMLGAVPKPSQSRGTMMIIRSRDITTALLRREGMSGEKYQTLLDGEKPVFVDRMHGENKLIYLDSSWQPTSSQHRSSR